MHTLKFAGVGIAGWSSYLASQIKAGKAGGSSHFQGSRKHASVTNIGLWITLTLLYSPVALQSRIWIRRNPFDLMRLVKEWLRRSFQSFISGQEPSVP
jgi:hypothetical protein